MGTGFLTASVAGPIYTSPSSENILSTLRTLGYKNKAGILVFVCNYTGDRLTFGIGVEKAQLEGITCEMVLIDDDTAILRTCPATGKRGLCGSVFMMKIAGAMADEGKSLQEIKAYIDDIKVHMGTISVGLTTCCLPGKDVPLFTMPREKMELGMGVHGEAGANRVPALDAAQTAQLMLDHLRNATRSTLPLKKGERIAVMLNNMGGLTTLEMNIMAKEVLGYLEKLELHVIRAFIGLYMTSLESAGLSVTILKVDDTMLHYIDYPTSAPAWTVPYCPEGCTRFTPPDVEPVPPKSRIEDEEDRDTGFELGREGQQLFRQAMVRACDGVLAHEKEFNRLDSECGDGDCGTTLSAGARAILAYLATRRSLRYPGQVFRHLSHVTGASMGGTSGAIYSLLFLGASRAFEVLTGYNAWVSALDLGMRLITKYGMARVGDRTMLDALNAVLTVVRSHGWSSEPAAVNALGERVLAATSKAVAATANMKAQAGRASYVNPSLLKNPDPGARAVEVWMGWVFKTLMANPR